MAPGAVLIAAASFDEHAYGPVAKKLEARGYPVVVYKTDKLLTGEDIFTIDLRSDVPKISYNDASIAPQDLSAAWYRKIGSFGLPDVESQLAKQLYMNNEMRALHDTIWPLFYPEEMWLSAPARILCADRKLGQLLTAREVGFTVPDTIVSSQWDIITDALLPNESDQIIVKMMRGVISDGNQVKALPTTILNHDSIWRLKRYAVPYPGIYQPYVAKAREWRVTVVGDNIFPVAIYAADDAKDDWRIHQDSGKVAFEKGVLPDNIIGSCLAYLKRLGLGFGAFDLIEEPNGRIVFLECNPNGQYGWLEEDLALPISDAIASELIRIAQKQ